MKKTLIAVSLFTVALFANAQKVTIAVKPATTVVSETNSETEMNIEAMGQSMEIKAKSQTFQTANVKKADGTTAEIDVTVTKKIMSLSAPGQDMTYDSDKDKDGDAADQFGKNVGKVDTWTLDKDGKRTNEPKADDEEKGGGMMSMMSGMLGGGASPIFDVNVLNKELKVGESWTSNTSDETGKVKNKTETKYTVKSIENNVATLDIVSTVTISGTIEQMGNEMEMQGKNTAIGVAKIDIITGLLLESDKTTTTSMTMSVQGMEMPMTGKITSKYKATIK